MSIHKSANLIDHPRRGEGSRRIAIRRDGCGRNHIEVGTGTCRSCAAQRCAGRSRQERTPALPGYPRMPLKARPLARQALLTLRVAFDDGFRSLRSLIGAAAPARRAMRPACPCAAFWVPQSCPKATRWLEGPIAVVGSPPSSEQMPSSPDDDDRRQVSGHRLQAKGRSSRKRVWDWVARRRSSGNAEPAPTMTLAVPLLLGSRCGLATPTAPLYTRSIQ